MNNLGRVAEISLSRFWRVCAITNYPINWLPKCHSCPPTYEILHCCHYKYSKPLLFCRTLDSHSVKERQSESISSRSLLRNLIFFLLESNILLLLSIRSYSQSKEGRCLGWTNWRGKCLTIVSAYVVLIGNIPECCFDFTLDYSLQWSVEDPYM